MAHLHVVQLYCRLIRPMNVFINNINGIVEIHITFTFFQNNTPKLI